MKGLDIVTKNFDIKPKGLDTSRSFTCKDKTSYSPLKTMMKTGFIKCPSADCSFCWRVYNQSEERFSEPKYYHQYLKYKCNNKYNFNEKFALRGDFTRVRSQE